MALMGGSLKKQEETTWFILPLFPLWIIFFIKFTKIFNNLKYII